MSIWFTKGEGKMRGIKSINTLSKENPFCQKQAKKNCVCRECYALQAEGYKQELVTRIRENSRIFSKPNIELENIFDGIIRFHSHGELINIHHFRNFLKLAFVNPNTIFGFWTKRRNMVQRYIRKGGIIPSNANMIFSNENIDKPMKVAPKGFDKVFNVFSLEYAIEHKININCGRRDCIDCRLCYSKNNVNVINEIRKNDQRTNAYKRFMGKI